MRFTLGMISSVGALVVVAACGRTEDGRTCTTSDGNTHADGDTFRNYEDSCSSCTCQDGAISCTRELCLKTSCEIDGGVLAVGSSFPAPDGCNRCRCQPSGEVSCTKIGCSDGG